MTSRVSAPVIILVLAAVESLAVSVFVPSQYSPNIPIWRTFTRLFVIQSTLYYAYHFIVHQLSSSPLRNLPQGSKESLVFGNRMVVYEQSAGRIFQKWMTTIPNDGLIRFDGFGGQDRLLVTNPKILREVLVTKSYDFPKPTILRDFLRIFLGDGLIVVEDDVHKFQRKSMMPSFAFRAVQNLYPMLWTKAVQLAQVVAEHIEQQMAIGAETPAVIEFHHWAKRVSLDMICKALGQDFQVLVDKEHPLIRDYEELLKPTRANQIFFVCNMLFSPDIVSKMLWKTHGRNERLLNNIKDVNLALVQERREQLKANAQLEQGQDILSSLIQSASFTDKELINQLLTILAAGHETTASTFTWVTFLLANNPEIQASLRAEVLQHLPFYKSDITEDFDSATLESLTVLNGVCNETLRLYPAVPMTIRISAQPTQLDGVPIPAGTQIIPSPWAINRDPALWGDDADEFNPDRWIDTDEREEKRPNKTGGTSSNYAFLTFLNGPRSCIGQGFARAQLRCLVAAFVASFEMEMADPKEDVVPYGVVAVKPKNGMCLKLKPLSS